MNRNKKLGKKWMAGVAVGMAGMMAVSYTHLVRIFILLILQKKLQNS